MSWRLVAAVSIGLAFGAQAQTEVIDAIPWAYAAYFGTGRYDLDGNTVYVLSARPRWGVREPALDEDGSRTVGIEIRLPIAVGLYRFDFEPDSTLRFDNISTISLVPSVEFDIPVTPRWSLKPLVAVGYGGEVGGDASAAIYWAGIKSELQFSARAFDWALVNGLTYVGYSNKLHERGEILPLMTGVEFARALPSAKIRGERVRLHWHVAYTSYLDEAEIGLSARTLDPVTLDSEWELGAAFSTGDRPLRWWRLHWDRVGLAYRFSNDGGFEGISLTFHSLYDR